MKRILLTISIIICWLGMDAQKANIAPLATVTCTGPSATLPPTALNDLNFGTCGTQQMWMSTSTPPSSTIGTDWIEWNWPTPQSFDEITIHHGDNTTRIMTGVTVQSWNGSAWVTAGSFTGLTVQCINTISFPRVTTNRFRFTRFEMSGPGQLSNPNFREIEIFRASTAPNDGGVATSDSVQSVCPGSYPVNVTVQNFGTNKIDSVLVNWRVDGILQTPVWYKSPLDTIGGSGSSFGVVTLGNFSFLANTNHLLVAWTSLPNNTIDTSTYNDTLTSIMKLGAPTGLVASNITATTALVSYNGLGGTTFNIEWGPSGFAQGTGTVVLAADTFATITGLLPLSTYDIYVNANCTGGNSAYAGPITITTGCPGAVVGAYTLDPALPYSSTNFVSFTQLALALDVCGITGPVTINVAPNSAFYEQITFKQVTGASATNTITINGNNASLAYRSTNTNERNTMELRGTDYMTIDSLRILALGSVTGEYGTVLRLTDGANYNTISNCQLIGDTASTLSNFACFSISGVNSGAATSSSGASGDYNLIENNLMRGGYYGLVCNGQSADSANGNIIRNNRVRDFRYYGLYTYYNNGITIEGNDVSRPFRTNLTTSYSVYIYGMSGGVVVANRIHDLMQQNTTLNASIYGMYMSQMTGTSSRPNLVANNLIYNLQGGGTIYGLYPTTASYTDIVHNTVVINDPASVATASTYCVYASGTLGDVNIQNNLVYLERGGTATKYLVYLGGTLTSSSKMDNNAFYATPSTTHNFGYSGAVQGKFSEWQAATKNDSNSFFLNPYLVNVSGGDFTPQSAVIDGLGANFTTQVSMDINGITRGIPADPGALEFTGAPCTGPNGVGVNSVTSNNAVIGWNTNTTAFTIEWGPVGFKQASLTGTIVNVALGNTTATLAGLSSNTCYDYYITQNCTSTIAGAPPVLGPLKVCTKCATPGLAGTYTIGGTPGPTNFATIDSAASVLNSCGILAPVVFNMNGGRHNAIKIENVSGASATNTITFNGSLTGDSIITVSGTAAIDLDGARYVTFNNLYVQNSGGNYVVWLHSGAKDINIMNCDLIGNKVTSSSATCVVAASNLSTSPTSFGDNVSNLTISGCKIVGNYYGVSLNGSATTSKIKNLKIIDSDFEDQYYYGIRTYYVDTVELRGNNLASFRNVNSYGLYLYYTDNFKVTENSVFVNTYALYSYYCNQFATSAATGLVANNMLSGSASGGGYFYAVKYLNAYHNTMTTNGTYACYISGSTIQGTTSSDNINFKNNIVAHTGTNYAMYIGAVPFGTFNLDYNLYSTKGTNLAYSGGARATLAAWQLAEPTKNVNSVSGDPQFASVNDLHVLGGLANDAGDNSVGITTDIDGQTRPQAPSTVVDIGADEYTPVASDIALISGNFSKNGKCLRTNDTIVLEIQNSIGAIKNFGTTAITANWSVTGPVNSNGTITVNTGTLAPQATAAIIGTPVNLSIPGVYTLNAYINPNADNLTSINDTLISSVTFTVYPVWEVSPLGPLVISNITDTVELEAKSPFFGGSDFFITEVCHYKYTVGAPLGGWPSYLLADDYIEITGVPGSDLGGITLEQWDPSSMMSTFTFTPGTLLGPNGTAIIAVGQMGSSVQSPSNFYYHGNGAYTGNFSSGGNNGRILKDANGGIIDAVGAGTTFSFPASSGVTAADWSGNSGNHSTTSGIRLSGTDLNNASNWVVSSVDAQDPNVVNTNVPVPTAGSVQGFTWSLNGNPIDTLPNTVVGPYSASGVYNYVATYNSPCGIFTSTVTVIVNIPGGGCQTPTNISGIAPACDSLIFSWNSAADSSIVAYVLTGGTMPAGTMVMGDSSYAVTGVTPNTNYDFYVANICKGDTGVFAGPYTLNSGLAGAPVATFTPTQALGGFTVTFDASATNGNGNTYSWDFGDGSAAGSGAMTSYTYTTGGNYSVKLTVTNACGSSDTTIALNGVSMGENILSQNLRLFPNPAKNTLHIELDIAGTSDITVRILDMSGKQVMNSVNDKTGERFEGNLNISELAPGVYMIEVTDGKYTAVRGLIKE